jgi:hypothetical protein
MKGASATRRRYNSRVAHTSLVFTMYDGITGFIFQGGDDLIGYI